MTRLPPDIWLPYLSDLHADWLRSSPGQSWREIDGTLVFADVSGFTPLTERLARLGKSGAEDLTDVLNAVFTALLSVASGYGGDCLKFGGDALLLLFQGPEHARRGAAAAHRMLTALRPFRRLRTGAGTAQLAMSIGVHAGTVHAFLVGDTHRELILTGPAVSETLSLEASAEPDQILLSPSAAGFLKPDECSGPPGEPQLLRRRPRVAPVEHEARVSPDQLALLHGIPEALVGHLGTVEGGEHRRSAVAFVQFRGTDELLRASGPEALAEALEHLVTQVQAICSDHSVTFLASDCDKGAGKLLLATGTPVASDDDEDRLAHALRAIVDIPSPLSVRAGAHRGRIFGVDLGSTDRRCFTVMGDVVNLAARVMGAAAVGEVLVTEAVTRRLRSPFERLPVAPFRVKGKSEPVVAAVLGPLQLGGGFGGGSDPPLAGRRRELAALQDALASAEGGVGRVVEIVGEPGLGKSRLLREVLNQPHDLAVTTFEAGRYSRGTPYLAIRRPLQELIGAPADAGPEETYKALRRTVEWLAPGLTPWLPLLGIPLGLDVPGTAETDRLDPAHRRARIQEVTLALLEQCLVHPTLIVIEDAHWLDDASIDLLQRLLVRVERHPWVAIVTRRDVPDGLRVQGGASCTHLRLAPLAEAEAAELVAAVEGAHRLIPESTRTLIERSGGNPLFLQELVTSVSSGGMAGPRAGPMAELPETVEAVLASSIDGLPAEERALLRRAAVLGTRFPATLLARVVGLPVRTLLSRLPRLDRFLGVDGEQTVRFRHVLIRDVAYETLAFRARRELHARAFEIISHTADAPVELLSLHAHYACRFRESWQHSQDAGDRALRSAAPVEAAAFYERALHATRHLTDLGSSEIADVAERQGEANLLAGQFQPAIGAYRLARRHARADHVRRAALYRKEGIVHERAGELAPALRSYRRGFVALAGAEDGPRTRLERARITNGCGIIRLFQGRHAQARALLEQAVHDGESSGDHKVLAETFRLMDWTLIELGEARKSDFGKRALAIFDEIGDDIGRSRQLQNFGVLAQYDGHWDDSVRYYQQSSEAAARAGDSVFCALNFCNIGEVLSDQGHYEEARRLFLDALDVFRSVDNAHRVALAASHLGRLAARTGDFDEASARLSEARGIFPDVGAKGVLFLEVCAREIEHLVLAGRPEPALRMGADLRERVERFGGVPYLLAMIDRLCGFALCQLGDARRGWGRLGLSLLAGRECQVDYEAALTMVGLVRVAPLVGAPDPARLGEEADAIFQRLGVVSIPEFPLTI